MPVVHGTTGEPRAARKVNANSVIAASTMPRRIAEIRARFNRPWLNTVPIGLNPTMGTLAVVFASVMRGRIMGIIP